MPTDDLQDRREQARLAMEGPKQREKREVEQKTLDEKRRTASLAMEGLEQRRRREKREREEAEREDIKRQIDKEVRQKKEEELAEKLKQAEAEQVALDAQVKERQVKTKKYQTSQNTIETLKQDTKISIPTIRTLKTDLARAVKEEGLSSARMAIKEQEKNPAFDLYSLERQPRGGWLVGASLTLLLLAASGFGVFYWLRNQAENNIIKPLIVNSIIPANNSQELDVSNSTADMVTAELKQILSASDAKGPLTYIYLTRSLTASSTDTRFVTKKIISAEDFLVTVSSPLPPALARFMNGYMLGTYQTASSTWPFLVFRINSYDNVAREFLSNENSYVRNILATLSGGNLDQVNSVPTFGDKEIKSKQTRVLTDTEGKIIFLYSFLDTTTLVIAPNEETFIRIYTAYNSPRPAI